MVRWEGWPVPSNAGGPAQELERPRPYHRDGGGVMACTTTLVAPPRRGHDGRGRDPQAPGRRQAGQRGVACGGGGGACCDGTVACGTRGPVRGRAGGDGGRRPACPDRRGGGHAPEHALQAAGQDHTLATLEGLRSVCRPVRVSRAALLGLHATSESTPRSLSIGVERERGAVTSEGGASMVSHAPDRASTSSSPAPAAPPSSAPPSSASSRSRPRCSRCGAFVPRVVVYPSRGDLAEREAGVCAVLWPALRGAAGTSVSRIGFADLALVVSLVMEVLARPGAVPEAVSLGRGPAPVGGGGR